MEKTHIKEKGITIITLVITIIILLILAGISITSLVGNDGLINKAKTAKEKAEKASIIEQIQTDIMAKQAENMSTDLSQNELKEILNKYVEKEEDIKYDETDTNKIASIITKDGKYEILLSDIWDGKTVINKDDSGDNTENDGQNSSSTEIAQLKSEIEKLNSTVKAMKELYDSKISLYDNKLDTFEENINKKQDKLNVSTGNLQLVGDYIDPSNANSKVRKYGNVVTVQATVAAAKTIPAGQTFMSIPKEFCPSASIATYVLEANGYVCKQLYINKTGEIMFAHVPWEYGWMVIEFSYICE